MAISKIKGGAINDDAISTAKIQNDAVTSPKIVDSYTTALQTNPEFAGTEAARMPQGTTAQRASAQSGDIRFNSTVNLMEYYDGTGWKSIDSAPSITSISPTTVTAAGASITVNGQFFASGGTAKFVGNDGTEYASPSVSFVNTTQLTITTPSSALTVANEPYDVIITNPSGLSGTLSDAVDAGSTPTLTQTAGATLATIFDKGDDYSPIATLTGADADGQALTFSESGSVLSGEGVTINSNGTITGDPNAQTAGTAVTKTFTAAATDGTNPATAKAFNIIIRSNTASYWWKNEDITDNSSSFAWNDANGTSAANMSSFGTYSHLAYTASDSDFGNKKTIALTGNNSAGLYTSVINNIHTNGTAFTIMMATHHNGGDSTSSTGETAVAFQTDQGVNDWGHAFDPAGDHTWGGTSGSTRGEYNGTGFDNIRQTAVWRHNGTSGTKAQSNTTNNYWRNDYRRYNQGSFTARQSGTIQQQQTGQPGINNRITMFNFSYSHSTSHQYVGKIAEVLFWEGRTISDTEMNYWGDYLAEKFSWT